MDGDMDDVEEGFSFSRSGAIPTRPLRDDYPGASRDGRTPPAPARADLAARNPCGPPLIGDDETKTVEVRGDGAPAPAEGFEDAGLELAVSRNVARCGFEIPTPLQRYSMPIVLAGRDLVACAHARTGSGRTAAFCIPVVSGLVAAGGIGSREGRAAAAAVARPRAHGRCVVLLLGDAHGAFVRINEEAKKLSYGTGLRVMSLVCAGMTINKLLCRIEEGLFDILVATPGCLVHAIKRSRLSLEAIKYLVVDEADRMLGIGLEPAMRKIVNEMNMPRKTLRQTLLFSATFPSEIQRLASDFLSNYIFLTVRKVETSTDLVRQRVEFIFDGDKRSYLLHALQKQYVLVACKLYQPLTLVFVETKREADSLRCWLCYKGFPTAVIHNERTQQERESALKSFEAGLTPILVITDAASRGLDFPNVAHVINYDLPKSIENYIHRIGRTGRAGKAGSATAFFTESNYSLAKGLLELMTEAKQDVPDWLEKYALDPRNKVDVGDLNEKDELSHWMSQPFEELELDLDKDICSTEKMAQEDEDPLMEGGIYPIEKNSKKILQSAVHDPFRLLGEEDDSLSDLDDYLSHHTYQTTEEHLVGVEIGFQKSSCPRVSYKKTLENGMKWMSEECFLSFRKHIEQVHFEDTEHKFGELRNQCFSFDVCDKIFHHYNFTVEAKHKHSDIWTPQLYFAEVKQLSGVKYYFCCPLEASDDGHCYGCKSQQMGDLKHPSKGGYEEGDADIFWPFMDDIADSDDDCDFDC